MLRGADEYARRFDEVPVHLLVGVDVNALAITDESLPRPSIVGGASVYPFVQNLLLALRHEGLGAAFTTLLVPAEPAIRELLAIPEEIVAKPGPLTDEEFAIVKGHPELGEKILAPIERLTDVRPIVRACHERWDGLGYPDGKAGTDIPVEARIVLVCDAFHAMVTDRPYRKRLPHEVAVGRLVEAMPDTSYPILKRIGFEEVAIIRRLEDPR